MRNSNDWLVGRVGQFRAFQKIQVVVAPCLSLDFSSFATRRPGLRIPSCPPVSQMYDPEILLACHTNSII
jgi:hypothetical protein